MNLQIVLLFLVVTTTFGYNIRGSESRELARRRYPNRRGLDLTVFFVVEEEEEELLDCTDYLLEKLDYCVDMEVILGSDAAEEMIEEGEIAEEDWVYFLEDELEDTDCNSLSKEIKRDLGCDTGYRVYRYKRSRGRGYTNKWYRFNKHRHWNRHRYDTKKSKKTNDKDWNHFKMYGGHRGEDHDGNYGERRRKEDQSDGKKKDRSNGKKRSEKPKLKEDADQNRKSKKPVNVRNEKKPVNVRNEKKSEELKPKKEPKGKPKDKSCKGPECPSGRT
ncbi:predicted protein [Thalassiosira pseudonana CCMP1335]|uniref:Uncharacterized protein n=1 Tax=Thalassiosira pseudonana TaxID=35128 RepID=B8CGP6_THAPS|nr:predicted protein [Thalassiosira pseudonana CCMP1335]EED87403.1 predicted protein [Thalassiosira pseudonana CCMP1335]